MAFLHKYSFTEEQKGFNANAMHTFAAELQCTNNQTLHGFVTHDCYCSLQSAPLHKATSTAALSVPSGH